MSRQFATNVTTIYDIFCPVPFLPSPFGFRRGKQPIYCGVQNYSLSGFTIFELFTVICFQDWAGWGIFTVILGNPRRTKGDSQHLEARPELPDWLRSELFAVKNSRTGPFSNYLGYNFELYSKKRPIKRFVLKPQRFRIFKSVASSGRQACERPLRT